MDAYKIEELTAEDFEGVELYTWIYSIKDPFAREQTITKARKRAKELKFTGFNSLLKSYIEKLKDFGDEFAGTNYTEYKGMHLCTGAWKVDFKDGVFKKNPNVTACSHPILPVRHLKSTRDGTIKVVLAFYKNGRWTEKVFPAATLAKANDIVQLAEYGISVTSGQRAQALVDFIQEVRDMNENVIPEVPSVSHLGWNEGGFAPYVGNFEMDADERFRSIYSSIHSHGSYDKWLEQARDIREYSLPGRIALAASFASPLIERLGCLPFFVHLWSPKSGTGKTVGLMLSASVWGDPKIGGGLLQSFDSTTVGTEVRADYLRSIPVIQDELQLAKDRRGHVDFNVYRLAAGIGRTRSNKALGLSYTNRWSNCFITSGESSIVQENAGAGAYNRVFEVECTSPVIRDGHKTAEILRKNYGFAGEIFIRELLQEDWDLVTEIYETYLDDCRKLDTTGKQAMAAALILTADALATRYIFKDGRELTVDDLAGFLKSESEVSIVDRGYELMCSWVMSNMSRFSDTAPSIGDWYGDIQNGTARIFKKVWNKACDEMGIDSRVLMSGLGLQSRTCRFGERTAKCVCMEMQCDRCDFL